MNSYLFDTDILIDIVNHQEQARRFLEENLNNSNYFISSISVAEMVSGWSKKQESDYLPFLLDIFKVVPIDTSIAKHAGELRFAYKKKGKSLTVVDTVIAASAMEKSASLVTANTKDFPMPQLNITNPREIKS